MDKNCCLKFNFSLIRIFSIVFAITGLAVIGGGIYLRVESNFNNFVFGIIVIGVLVTVVSVGGFFIIKNRSLLVLIYAIAILLFTFFFMIFGLLCFFYDKLPDKIAEVFKDSKESVEKFRKVLVNLKTPTGIVFLIITVVGLTTFVLLIVYRHNVIINQEKKDQDYEDGVVLLRKVNRKNKKEELYNESFD